MKPTNGGANLANDAEQCSWNVRVCPAEALGLQKSRTDGSIRRYPSRGGNTWDAR